MLFISPRTSSSTLPLQQLDIYRKVVTHQVVRCEGGTGGHPGPKKAVGVGSRVLQTVNRLLD